jgi:hypothetical protein
MVFGDVSVFLVGLDTTRGMLLATGRVGPKQQEWANPTRLIEAFPGLLAKALKGASGLDDYMKAFHQAKILVAMHHHPLPPASPLLEGAWEQIFTLLGDAGAVLHGLLGSRVSLVLHGHKHAPSMSFVSDQPEAQQIPILAAGTATGEACVDGDVVDRATFHRIEITPSPALRVEQCRFSRARGTFYVAIRRWLQRPPHEFRTYVRRIRCRLEAGGSIRVSEFVQARCFRDSSDQTEFTLTSGLSPETFKSLGLPNLQSAIQEEIDVAWLEHRSATWKVPLGRKRVSVLPDGNVAVLIDAAKRPIKSGKPKGWYVLSYRLPPWVFERVLSKRPFSLSFTLVRNTDAFSVEIDLGELKDRFTIQPVEPDLWPVATVAPDGGGVCQWIWTSKSAGIVRQSSSAAGRRQRDPRPMHAGQVLKLRVLVTPRVT